MQPASEWEGTGALEIPVDSSDRELALAVLSAWHAVAAVEMDAYDGPPLARQDQLFAAKTVRDLIVGVLGKAPAETNELDAGIALRVVANLLSTGIIHHARAGAWQAQILGAQTAKAIAVAVTGFDTRDERILVMPREPQFVSARDFKDRRNVEMYVPTKDLVVGRFWQEAAGSLFGDMAVLSRHLIVEEPRPRQHASDVRLTLHKGHLTVHPERGNPDHRWLLAGDDWGARGPLTSIEWVGLGKGSHMSAVPSSFLLHRMTELRKQWVGIDPEALLLHRDGTISIDPSTLGQYPARYGQALICQGLQLDLRGVRSAVLSAQKTLLPPGGLRLRASSARLPETMAQKIHWRPLATQGAALGRTGEVFRRHLRRSQLGATLSRG